MMKKFTLLKTGSGFPAFRQALFLLFSLSVWMTKAQTMPYTFSQSSGTYTAITGGTVFQSGATISTDAVSSAITLPFTFTFNGTACDRVYISNNGFITLANSTTTTAPTATTYNPISAATGYVGAIAGYGYDMRQSTASGASSEIRYQTLNSTPNQVFVVQFTDIARSTNPSSEKLTFQIRLSETTNKVDIVYNTPTVAATSTTASNFGQVGLRGSSNTSFSNRMVYATSPYNTWSASGAAGDNGNTARITSGTGVGGPNVMIFTTAYFPTAGLTYSWTPVSSSFYQSLPYTQNFESAWQNMTSVGDVPAANGVLTMPGTGNGSVRASDVTTANSVWSGTSGSSTLGAAQGSRSARFHTFNHDNAVTTNGLSGKGYLDFYLNFSTAGTKQLSFDYINPTGTDVLNIYLSTDGGKTFGSSLGSYGVSAAWSTKSIASVSSSTSSTCVIRFEFTSDYGNDDIYVDNVSVTSLSTCTTPSAQPSSLSFGTTSSTSIAGSFTAPATAPSGYLILRSTSSTAPTPVNGTTYTTANTVTLGGISYYVIQGSATTANATTFTDSGLTSNTGYYYYVFSYNNACSGAPYYLATSPLSGNKVTCAAAPTAATTPVTGITSSSATINWVASVAGGSAGTINYIVEVYTDSGYTTPIPGSPYNAGTSTSQAITFTNAATTYYYRIKANNGSCDSAYLTGSFVPSCAVPTGLAATASATTTGISSISGNFTATGSSSVPTGYLVVRSTSSSLPVLSSGVTYTVGANTSVATNGYIEYVGTTVGSWTSSSLMGGTTYYYFVFSYNNTGCSGGPIYSASATQTNATTTGCPAFSSVISVGGSVTTSGSVYPTLTAAIADLSVCSISQPTTLSINSSYNSSSETFPIVIPSISGSSSTNTVTIKPAAGTSPVISGTAASNPLIKINGGSNVIIDGSNSVGGTTRDLILTNTSATSPNVVVIGSPDSTPVTNVILKNTVLTNGANTSSAVVVSSSATIGNAGYFNNITIQNNSVNKAYVGIYVIGNTAANNGNGLLIDGNTLNSSGANSIRLIGIYVQGVDGNSVISNNTVGNISNSNSESVTGIWLATAANKAAVYGNNISGVASTVSGSYTAGGIYVSSGSTVSAINIYNNNISNISSLGSYVDGSTGIEIGGATANVNIYSNKISNIKNTNTSGYGAAGIFLGSSATAANTASYNNMIWDVAGYGSATLTRNGHGIYLYSGGGYKLYYNSVNLTTNQTTGVSAALYIYSSVSTASSVDMRNNIFANSQTSNTRYAIYSTSAKTIFSNIDYNDYYSAGTLGYLGSAQSTIAAWQTATGSDVNSLNVLPPFVSATDLHLSGSSCTPIESAGTPISGISTDIDNDSRSSSNPDLGADEFNGNALPKITSVTGGSNCGTGTIQLTANGSTLGSAITEYRWYSAVTGGTLVGTSSTNNWTTPSISTTTNYYVAAYNGCESNVRTLVTATINPVPTDINIASTVSPGGADACTTDYVKLEATGGVVSTPNSNAVNLTFENGLTDSVSGSWTTSNTSTAGTPANAAWTVQNNGYVYSSTTFNSNDASKFIISNSDAQGSGSTTNTELRSPIFSLKNYTSASLTFYHYYRYNSGDSGTVQISTDGGSNWVSTNLASYSSNQGSSNAFSLVTIDLASYVGQENLMIRFLYSASYDWYWALDNIKVSGSKSEQQIVWTPVTGLYTNSTLTTAYTAGSYAATLYAAPDGTQSYTAKSTQGTCDKTSVVSVTKNKNEFTGAVDTNWNTAGNWSINQVPNNTKCVIIPADKTVVININNAEVKSLTIASTGKTTITANNSLKVVDGITITNNSNNDNLTLESDAVLLQENGSAVNTGKILAHRDVKMRKMDYIYWSTPVSGQKLLNDTTLNDGFSVGTPNNRILYYYEPNDTFKAVPSTETTFVTAKGYAIRGKDSYDASVLTSDNTLKFVGTPNNGSYTINIQKSANTGTGGTVEHGYNLIGNPYPSNIDFVKFFNLSNNKNIIYGKAWFWSNITPTTNQQGSSYSGNNYATITLAGGTPPTYSDTTVTPSPSSGAYTPTKNIKVGQGFIVQAKNIGTGQTLSFDNTIRNNEAGVFYNNKSSEDVNRYWLKLITPQNIINTILVAYMDGATNAYDGDYDADLIAVGDDSFYSKLSTHKFQIQARASFADNDVVSLGTKYSANGTYKISLENNQGVFGENQNVYLKDKLLNSLTNLREKDYSFSAIKGTDETRFEIVYKEDAVLASDGATKSEFEIYRSNGDYIIKSSKQLGKIEVYDSSGRLMMTANTKEKILKLDTSVLVNGVYIIKAENSGDIRTKKIIK